MLWGVGLLAAALVLLELLAFRLGAAAIGFRFAYFAALVSPVVAGVGAALIAPRGPDDAALLARRAAHLATLGGAWVIVGSIGITWTSQQIAQADGEGTLLHVGIGLASVLPGPMLCGAALAVAMRVLIPTVGRAGYALGLGGAVGCLSIPLFVEQVGAPRSFICVAFLIAGSAALLGRAGAKPRWSLIATLPLVVISLVSGDYGEPWMKMRTDKGKRGAVDYAVWTSEGVFSVSNVTRSKARMSVDRWAPVGVGRREKPPKKPQLGLADLQYELNHGDDRGAVLVIAPGAGRQVATALAHDQVRVDVVEEEARHVNELMLDRYFELTDRLYADERVHVHIGGVRAQVAKLPNDFEHITVLEQMRFHHAAPRLLTHDDRLFTRAAVDAYIAHLRPGGSLLLEVPVAQLMQATRVVADAVADPANAPRQIVSCAHDTHGVVLFVAEPLSAGAHQKVTKRCKRMKATVTYPVEEVRRGSREADKLTQEREAKLAHFDTLLGIDDDRPFFDHGGPIAALVPAALRGLKGLAPTPEYERKRPKKGEPPAEETADATDLEVAAGALSLALALLVLGLFTRSGGASGADRGVPLVMRLSFPAFGAGLALSTFALTDVLVRMMGSTLSAWSVVIPVGLAGVGGGRLFADTLSEDRGRLQRTGVIALAAAMAWLLSMYFGTGTLLGIQGMGSLTKTLVASSLATVTGGLLGFPLALGLRVANTYSRPPVAWAWAMHGAGWGLGGAVAAVCVHFVGVRAVWLLGAGGLALGAALLLAARQRHPKPVSEPKAAY